MERFVFLVSLTILAFGGGLAAAHFDAFPYPQALKAAKTARHLVSGSTIGPEGRPIERREVPDEGIAEARWDRGDDMDRSVLVYGGHGQFLDICPDTGCVAVLYDDTGAVVESWPFRLDAILAADEVASDYPREGVPYLNEVFAYPIGMNRYPDGDLQVLFQAAGSIFPFGWGIARLAPDGTPRWYRKDYSHHWAHMLEDGTTLVPSLRIGDGLIPVEIGQHSPNTPPVRRDIQCETGRPQIDNIAVVSGEGGLRREIEIFDPLRESAWAGLLSNTVDPCDPLHLNFIDIVEAGEQGDLPKKIVVSLRNISAFGVFDLETGTYDGVYSGSFVRQHSVHHLGGTRFIIFDNMGGDTIGGGSRVLTFDTATMAERRVFPSAEMSGIFSRIAGHIDLSSDRRRALVSFSAAGRGVEIDIETGALLSSYTHLHPVMTQGNGGAALHPIYGMAYVDE